MLDLKDKVVVITGASRGIGAAMVRHFGLEGSKVVLIARNKDMLTESAMMAGLTKGNFHLITADITKRAGIKKIAAGTMKKFGRIDIWINNAGVGVHKSILETTEAEYNGMYDTNMKAVYFSFLEAIPIMQKQKQGHIINISSASGLRGEPMIAVYSSSKAALNAFSEAVAREVRNDGIKISVLAPASVDTDFAYNFSGERKQNTVSKAKMKLTADEVAEAVVGMAKDNPNAWTSLAVLRPLSVK